MESKKYTKKRGGVTASLLAYKDGNTLISVCCGLVNVDGNTVASITMDEYGLLHTYRGEDKEDVDATVLLLQEELANDFGLEFDERTSEEEETEDIEDEHSDDI